MQFCKRSFSSALKITVQKIESFASDGHSGRDFVDKCLICKRAGIELSSPLTKRSSTEAKREANSIKYETTFFLRSPFAVKASFARSCYD